MSAYTRQSKQRHPQDSQFLRNLHYDTLLLRFSTNCGSTICRRVTQTRAGVTRRRGCLHRYSPSVSCTRSTSSCVVGVLLLTFSISAAFTCSKQRNLSCMFSTSSCRTRFLRFVVVVVVAVASKTTSASFSRQDEIDGGSDNATTTAFAGVCSTNDGDGDVCGDGGRDRACFRLSRMRRIRMRAPSASLLHTRFLPLLSRRPPWLCERRRALSLIHLKTVTGVWLHFSTCLQSNEQCTCKTSSAQRIISSDVL
jgi:hypothetical protein